jgi:hypothetical protein
MRGRANLLIFVFVSRAWNIEMSFRMSTADLRAQLLRHPKRDSIRAGACRLDWIGSCRLTWRDDI